MPKTSAELKQDRRAAFWTCHCLKGRQWNPEAAQHQDKVLTYLTSVNGSRFCSWSHFLSVLNYRDVHRQVAKFHSQPSRCIMSLRLQPVMGHSITYYIKELACCSFYKEGPALVFTYLWSRSTEAAPLPLLPTLVQVLEVHTTSEKTCTLLVLNTNLESDQPSNQMSLHLILIVPCCSSFSHGLPLVFNDVIQHRQLYFTSLFSRLTSGGSQSSLKLRKKATWAHQHLAFAYKGNINPAVFVGTYHLQKKYLKMLDAPQS